MMKTINRNEIKKVVGFASLTIIVAFMFVFSVSFFKKIFIDTEQIAILGFASAFFGAFFAFLFSRLAEYLNAIYHRRKEHRDSLVKCERMLNKFHNIIATNIYIVDDLNKMVAEVVKTRAKGIYFNEFKPIPPDETATFRLMDIRYLNDIENFFIDLRTTNEDLDRINFIMAEVRTAFVQKNIDGDAYIANMEMLADKTRQIKIFLEELARTTVSLAAKTATLLENKPFIYNLFKPLGLTDSYTAYEKVRFRTKEKEIKATIINNMAKSTKRLEELFKESNGK